MKRYQFPALAVCLLLISALQAGAQFGDEPSPRLAVKVGVYSPFGSGFDQLKSMWRCLGAEYALSTDDLHRPTMLAGAMMTSSDGDTVEASMLGLQCEKRWYANDASHSSLYYGGGLGYYMLKAKDREFAWMEWTDRSGGKLGVTAVAGYQYQESYFGEVRFNYSGELSNGLDFSGLSLNLGMRLTF